MFLKSEEAQQIKCTVYRSAKFLKFFVRFDQILYIFFEKLSASGGLCPPDPLGLPPTRMLLPPPLLLSVNTVHYQN